MTLPEGSSLAELAAVEYERRVERAQVARREQGMTAKRATELLAPWASLLLRLAPDPADLVEKGPLKPLAGDWQLFREGAVHGPPIEPEIAALALAEDLCPRARMLEEIAKARDAALLRNGPLVTDPGRRAALMRLVTLANAMGSRPADPSIFRSKDAEERAAA